MGLGTFFRKRIEEKKRRKKHPPKNGTLFSNSPFIISVVMWYMIMFAHANMAMNFRPPRKTVEGEPITEDIIIDLQFNKSIIIAIW